MSAADDVACVLVAAGRGERLGESRPKALVEVAGMSMVEHAVRAIAASQVRHLVVVAPEANVGHMAELVRAHAASLATSTVVAGGATRQASVARGLDVVPAVADVVLVHDAARCLAPAELYDDVARAVLDHHDAVIPGLPVVDTLKEVDDDGRVRATLSRARLRAIQTPQGFRRSLLLRAHAAAGADEAPDDASMVEALGVPVQVVTGHPDAFKVTRPLDLALAEIVAARSRPAPKPAP